jgi:hypothetical protein
VTRSLKVSIAVVAFAGAPLASAALPPMFLFGPPRNIIIPPVGPWVFIDGPVNVDAPPIPDEPSAESDQEAPQAAIHRPAPPPDPLPYPGPGQPEES